LHSPSSASTSKPRRDASSHTVLGRGRCGGFSRGRGYYSGAYNADFRARRVLTLRSEGFLRSRRPQPEPDPETVTNSSASASKDQTICASCHLPEGNGNGAVTSRRSTAPSGSSARSVSRPRAWLRILLYVIDRFLIPPPVKNASTNGAVMPAKNRGHP